MAITDAFRIAVSEGDVRGIRIMMKDSLLVDPTFIEFNEMDKIAKNVNGLYEAHDGREINNNNSIWDDNYMSKLMVQVVGNFSPERVDHLKDVVRHLRPVTAKSRQSTMANRSAPRQTNRGTKVAAGAVAGGVVGGAIAGAVSVPILAGATAGAIVVGVAVAIATNEG